MQQPWHSEQLSPAAICIYSCFQSDWHFFAIDTLCVGAKLGMKRDLLWGSSLIFTSIGFASTDYSRYMPVHLQLQMRCWLHRLNGYLLR